MREIIKNENLLWERYIILGSSSINYLKSSLIVNDNEYVLDKVIDDIHFKRNCYKANTIIFESNFELRIRVDLLLNFIDKNKLINVKYVAVRSYCHYEVQFCSPTYCPHPKSDNFNYIPNVSELDEEEGYHICSNLMIQKPTNFFDKHFLVTRTIASIIYDIKTCILRRHNKCRNLCCITEGNGLRLSRDN